MIMGRNDGTLSPLQSRSHKSTKAPRILKAQAPVPCKFTPPNSSYRSIFHLQNAWWSWSLHAPLFSFTSWKRSSRLATRQFWLLDYFIDVILCLQWSTNLSILKFQSVTIEFTLKQRDLRLCWMFLQVFTSIALWGRLKVRFFFS